LQCRSSERTTTREEVSSLVVQQVRLHDVTVSHEVLPNPETVAEQNRHLITSMSPPAQSTSVITSSVGMQRPFPTPLPSTYCGQWSCAVVTAYSRWKLGPNKGRWYIPCVFEDTSISASCLTTVNASLYFVPGILAVGLASPLSAREVWRVPLRWTSAGTNISKVTVSFLLLGGET
jgi:hypothetical protein